MYRVLYIFERFVVYLQCTKTEQGAVQGIGTENTVQGIVQGMGKTYCNVPSGTRPSSQMGVTPISPQSVPRTIPSHFSSA